MTDPLESPESSTPIITRAVAAGLRRQFYSTYPLPKAQRLALKMLSLFPQDIARYAITRFEALSGIDPQRLSDFDYHILLRERLEDYHGLIGPFPCITIGAGLGGASAHLSLATGGPFLPQAFVLTLRGGSPDGDITTYLHRSLKLAASTTQKNPELLAIQHYDPIHDEWMTRYVNHLRFKLLDLPEEYKVYIRQNLKAGGAICYLDCEAKWLRYRLGDRHYFQVGGWGDISPEEYLDSSQRIRQYAQQVKLAKTDWRLGDYPLERGPESEWGSEPALIEKLEEFCDQEGYTLVTISLPEPHDYSRLAYQACQRLISKAGREPQGVLIEMFSQFDPTAVFLGGLLPLWLVYNTWDSLAFLKTMLESFPAQKQVFFAPLATFTPTPDLVPWKEWEAALQGLSWINIGARASHYPADAKTLLEWQNPLQSFVTRHPSPILDTLEAQELLEMSRLL